MNFDTVNELLEQWQKGQRTNENVEALKRELAREDTIAFPPSALKLAFEYAVEKKCGDEAFRSISLMLLSYWLKAHQKAIHDFSHRPGVEVVIEDKTKIELAIKLLSEIGSMSGDKQWKETILEEYKAQTDA
jgi:hypothetical protein